MPIEQYYLEGDFIDKSADLITTYISQFQICLIVWLLDAQNTHFCKINYQLCNFIKKKFDEQKLPFSNA